jgi:general secretion pathway protein N
MRLDRIAPRTWLLATVAAWAIACWLLALAGLGTHAAVLPDDPALLQPLPAVPPPAQPRLAPMTGDAAVIARPLFANDRRPHPFAIEATEEGEPDTRSAFDYMLTSVLIVPTLRMAIVQPTGGGDGIGIRLGESVDAIPGWRLVELTPRGAVFEGPGGRKSLALRTYDGTEGEPPSQVPAAVARQRAIDAADAEEAAQAADVAVRAAETPAEPAPPAQAQQQMESIRKRIEARRAQMRREAAESTAPDRNP